MSSTIQSTSAKDSNRPATPPTAVEGNDTTLLRSNDKSVRMVESMCVRLFSKVQDEFNLSFSIPTCVRESLGA